MENLRDNFLVDFHDSVEQEEFQQILKDFNDHVEKMSGINAFFAFWSYYVELVELLLLFLRATSEGNRKLHRSAICCMLPWYFSYGKVNYSRYLPVYLKDAQS